MFPQSRQLTLQVMQMSYTMAERLGITAFTSNQSQVASMGIGSGSATLLQMTDAYQAFADNGMRVPPHGILDIWDNYGHRLYHYDTTPSQWTGRLSAPRSLL